MAYARYNYSNTATLVNIINDINAVLTGETNKANLSAGCDQTNTFILNTYANAGWTLHDQTANSIGTQTITNASPAVVNAGTQAGDLLSADMPVSFTTTGTLPTGLSPNTVYYVSATGLGAATCQVSATVGGASINTSSAGSGTHTMWTKAKTVLKAAVVDDAAFYKYAMLDLFTAGFAQLHLYETWNETTHAGTNLATAIATTGQQRITVSTAASITMAVSARYIAMQSIIAAGLGDSDCNSWTGIFERSRLAPWDTTANAYPPSLITRGSAFGWYTTNSMVGGAAPRFKNPAGGDYTTVDAVLYPAMMGWHGYPTAVSSGMSGVSTASGSAMLSSSIKTKVPDGLGGFYTPFNEFQFRNPLLTTSFEGGSISSICDVWNTVAYPNNLDEVVKGSTTYIIWQNTLYSTITAYSATKGYCSGNTVFPKG